MNTEIQSFHTPSIGQLNILFNVADQLIGKDMISVIFEFGSRYGEDTIEFAKKYPKALVYGFECNPKSIPFLRSTIGPIHNVIFNEKAVSDFDGTVSFFQINESKTRTTWADGNQGASSMYKASGKYPLEDYHQDLIEVESLRLDTFMTNNKIEKIDILWMDIQGAELKALHGLGEKLNVVKIIQLEVEFIEIYSQQPLFRNINDFLKKNNFCLLGFSAKNNFSGDAIFVNLLFFDNQQIDYAAMIIPKQRKTLQLILKRVMFLIKYAAFRLKKKLLQ